MERFGNVHRKGEGSVVDEVREPLVDVFDEHNEVVVTAELPGATEAEISVEIKGDLLTIEMKGERSYAKEVVLPGEVDAASLQKKYNNGVLELRIRKKEHRERVPESTAGRSGSRSPGRGSGERNGGRQISLCDHRVRRAAGVQDPRNR